MNDATRLTPLAHKRNSIFKCKQRTCTLNDSREPDKYNYTMMLYGATFYSQYRYQLLLIPVLKNAYFQIHQRKLLFYQFTKEEIKTTPTIINLYLYYRHFPQYLSVIYLISCKSILIYMTLYIVSSLGSGKITFAIQRLRVLLIPG